jgi:ABC-type antimicrobial peptide transport system ATPase subunit
MGKASFYRLLESLKNDKNMGILMVSHDIGMVFEACDTVMCINKTLHCHTSADKIRPEELQSAFSGDPRPFHKIERSLRKGAPLMIQDFVKDIISYGFLRNALVAAILVSSLTGVFSSVVVLRG